MIYSITEIEARYAETDKMGVIYQVLHLLWWEGKTSCFF
ncbi:4-hydroxybenzoyl-CoA thioesterase family active site protein [Staphylococcus aureus]|nr:4-hydroxybenzoyl-CoA thioesterase family active site protein [Staphylococcus aureus]